MTDQAGCKKRCPKWREDFPIETEGDDFIVRRDFIRFLGLVSAGLTVGSGVTLARGQGDDERSLPPAKVASAGELSPGMWKSIRYPEHSPAILVRREDGQYLAYQSTCPHLGCPVTYEHDADGERLACHCHNGKFDLASGTGVAGPPRELRPLRGIVVEERQDGIWAVAMRARVSSKGRPHG